MPYLKLRVMGVSINEESRVFFPVRSNAGWFKSPETVKFLEAKLKMAVFCFDKVVLENYRYELNVTANGAYEMPGLIPSVEERGFRFDEGGEVSLSFGPLDENGNPDINTMTPYIWGTALASYHADFVPILYPQGVLKADCFGWVNTQLSDEEKKPFEESARKDAKDGEFWKSLPFPNFEKNYVAHAYYHDIAWVEKLRMPFSLDSRVSDFVRLKDLRLLGFIPDSTPNIYEAALLSGMPDVSFLNWEELLEVRETAAAQAFRDMLSRIRFGVLYELENLRSQRDVSQIASELFIKEILEEVKQFMPSRPGVAFGIALNLLPALGGVIGGVTSVSDYIKSRQSWITLFTNDAQ